MIDFSYDVTIPANTNKNEPYTEALKVTKGKVTRVLLTFQTGCAYMVHVHLGRGVRQLLPIIEGQSYAFDGYVLERETSIIMEDDPFELVFTGWSDNTSYDHTIGVLISVETEENSEVVAELLARLL